MSKDMNRREYIQHLDSLRAKLGDLGAEFARASLVGPTLHEMDREKKTMKTFEDLSLRLFEDAAVVFKTLQQHEANGIGEQGVLDIDEDDLLEEAEVGKKKPGKKGGK